MGLPQENAAGCDRGSPLTYAKNLWGRLLIVRGSGDDNVHLPEHRSDGQRAGGEQGAFADGVSEPQPLDFGRHDRQHLFTVLKKFVEEIFPQPSLYECWYREGVNGGRSPPVVAARAKGKEHDVELAGPGQRTRRQQAVSHPIELLRIDSRLVCRASDAGAGCRGRKGDQEQTEPLQQLLGRGEHRSVPRSFQGSL